METHAKLDGVVLYGDVHPSTVIHLVNRTCENLQGGRNPSIIKNRGPIIIRRTCAGLEVSYIPSWKKCEAGWCGAFCRYSS